MTITVSSTSRIVELSSGGKSIQARVWEGKTERGIPVIALIPRVAVKNDQDCSQFEAELEELAPPSVEAVEAFPLRMIL